MQQEETKARFLIRNLIRGLLWFAVIIVAFIFAEQYIEDNLMSHIDDLQSNVVLLYFIYTLSEIVFGILPPEIFMMLWSYNTKTMYILNVAALASISYGAGVLGYYVGKSFSKTPLYRRIHVRYLAQYNRHLKRFGGYLVLVGAITPIPFSATCMMAGSINLPINNFLLICLARIARFAFFGWMVWSFPSLFNG